MEGHGKGGGGKYGGGAKTQKKRLLDIGRQYYVSLRNFGALKWNIVALGSFLGYIYEHHRL